MINLSRAFIGQAAGSKQVAEQIWPVSFVQYDPGFFDHESGRIGCAPIPFQAKVLPMSPELSVTVASRTDNRRIGRGGEI